MTFGLSLTSFVLALTHASASRATATTNHAETTLNTAVALWGAISLVLALLAPIAAIVARDLWCARRAATPPPAATAPPHDEHAHDEPADG